MDRRGHHEEAIEAAPERAAPGAAEDLGVLRVRVSGLDPATPYFFHTTTTPKAAGAPVQLPASGALYSTVTAVRSVAESANDLAADLLDTDGSTVLPGALLGRPLLVTGGSAGTPVAAPVVALPLAILPPVLTPALPLAAAATATATTT